MFIDRRSHKQGGVKIQNSPQISAKPRTSTETVPKKEKSINLTTLSSLPDQIITASKDSQEVTFDTDSVSYFLQSHHN